MKLCVWVLVCILLAITLVLFTDDVQGSPSPKKGRGSKGSIGGSSGSSFGGSKKPKTSNPNNVYKSKNSKKSFGKKVAKAAAFGAGAYIGAKVAKKLTKAFSKAVFGAYSYDQWQGYADVDGALCRNDYDCTWIDPNLGCDDREFQITLVKGAWPWKADLVGHCTCQNGFLFSDDASCVSDSGMAIWLIVLIVILVIGGCVCCCCIAFKILS